MADGKKVCTNHPMCPYYPYCGCSIGSSLRECEHAPAVDRNKQRRWQKSGLIIAFLVLSGLLATVLGKFAVLVLRYAH